MKEPLKKHVFLERATYRQRRLRDAARFLPLLGAVLWVLPLMWPREVPDAPGSSDAAIFIFGVWVLLILLSAAISWALHPEEAKPSEDGDI